MKMAEESYRYGVALRCLMGARVHVCEGPVGADLQDPWRIINDKFNEVLTEAHEVIEATEYPLVYWNSLMTEACYPYPMYGRYL